MRRHADRRRAAAALWIAAPLLALAGERRAGAQPWVPPQGTGSVEMAVQRIDHNGHLLSDGSLDPGGTSLNVSIFVEGEYAVTDRLVVSLGLPYVFGRYTDTKPPPAPIPFLPVDQCRCWNSGVQDFDGTVRYNVSNRTFGLTPSISFGVPSHNYPYQGEAVLGRDLKELTLAVDAGQRLDRITPRLSVEGRYAYAFVQRILDVPNNRSNSTIALAYRVTPRLAARGLASWQRTHGGLRVGSPTTPGDINTPELLANHDRLLRDDSLHAGGMLAYQLPAFDVFASYVSFVSGTDTHAGHAVTFGVSWPFELPRDRHTP